MKPLKLIIIFSTLLVFSSCRQRSEPQHVVALPDVSASIVTEADKASFRSIENLVRGMRRGDRIAIIPILSDAAVDAQGNILRFEVPAHREAYDADLQQFRKRASAELETLHNRLRAHPSLKTDILGTLRLASEEFATDNEQTTRTVIVLSDFIQDDGTVDFKSDSRLRDQASATEFARELAKSESLPLRNIHVYLGGLRSSDLSKLDNNRRGAIREFWLQYLTACGAQPRFQTDGPGMLESMVQSSN